MLREAGLIRTRVHGTRRLVTLRHDDLERRFPGLLAMLREPAPSAAAPTPGPASPVSVPGRL